MAANCARRTLLSFSPTASAILNGSTRSTSSSSSAAAAAKTAGLASARPTSARLHRHRFASFSRLPLELGCAQSLMPLHSVTASALLTSMLSLKSGNWGWFSEGFATPL